MSPSVFFHLRETFSLVFHPKNKIRNESNEGSDAAGNFRSTDRRLVDDSVHHQNKDRHGGDNRSDLILGIRIEGQVENELDHRHSENREGDHQKRFFKDPVQQIT